MFVIKNEGSATALLPADWRVVVSGPASADFVVTVYRDANIGGGGLALFVCNSLQSTTGVPARLL